MHAWHEGKLLIENNVPVSHDALHLIFGTLVWLGFVLLLRRQVGSSLPWGWALAVILWNEAVDLWTEQWPYARMQYRQGIKDVLLTLFVPTVLILAAKLKPELYEVHPKRRR